jgi:hypothetical protein
MTIANIASQGGCVVTGNSGSCLQTKERVFYLLHRVHIGFKEQEVSYSIAIAVHFVSRKATEESTCPFKSTNYRG